MTAVDPTTSAPSYPFSPPRALDLDPVYERLRRDEPITRVRMPFGEGTAWLVTRHADARTVLGDPRFSMAAGTTPETPRSTPFPLDRDSILGMDAPEHTRLRRLVAKAFTARRVEQMRPRLRELVDSSLTEMEKHGAPADLVHHLALPLPVTVICDMLGVPYEDRHLFRSFSDAVLSTTKFTQAQIEDAREKFLAYMGGLVARRRADPTDDLLGALVLARDNDDRLSEMELVRLGITLLVAGHETTANQLTNFTYLLLSQPERYQALVADPSLVPAAVEELLRFTPLGASGGFVRVALEDVELAGVTVRKGESVFAQNASANRDDAVFDLPNEIDFNRPHNPHIAFGHGLHHCLGAQLARLELQVALEGMIARFPNLRFAVPVDELPWRTGMLVRGLEALPVAW
ncbi:cytochrome P450 [Allokutzneria sp. A3M-2-11 16]|uniref:cytochrome P450 n=1 Tax=Allokutzneria sp. A3M-2-11 16 TaxID=2962043 RepID=UPI0020B8F87A|nr:cytochrome P450 [Allokutzneria sp. A3M-2-11 16]MCP3800968.1 cytochrome P450 [Allokutzneria sp. A3M-2-11 16]